MEPPSLATELRKCCYGSPWHASAENSFENRSIGLVGHVGAGSFSLKNARNGRGLGPKWAWLPKLRARNTMTESDIPLQQILDPPLDLINMLALLILALLLLQSAAQSEYTIVFEGRVGDYITLGCRHVGRFLQINDTIRYWLNRTDSVRPTDDFEDDLLERLGFQLRLSGPPNSHRSVVTFLLTPDLEGRYTCGKKTSENNVDESEPIFLACKC
jgi:hypothetical protein